MPTVQQLEQRLKRLTKTMAAAPRGKDDSAASLRLMHKRQRRLQRKLRHLRPAPAGKTAGTSAPSSAEPQGEKKG